MKNKFKGFTLIELLAVIVILAIIALIASPIVIGIIDDSRMEASERSAEAYIQAIKNKAITNVFEDENSSLEGEYTIANGIMNGTGMTNVAIEISGAKPTAGKLTYDDNTLQSGYLVIGDYKVTVENGKITGSTKNVVNDTTPPVVTIRSVTKAGDISLVFDVTDNESDILLVTVEYGNDTNYGHTASKVGNAYMLDCETVVTGNYAYYKITAINSAGLTTEYADKANATTSYGGAA